MESDLDGFLANLKKVRPKAKPKQRLDESAYKLFSEKGINAVGINELIGHSGVSLVTLYRHYKSKDDLILAFLDRHEKQWTIDWLAAEVNRRISNPRARLLAIFDLFDEWFQESGFRGCPLINTLIESKFGAQVHRAAAQKLANIDSLVKNLAIEADLTEAEDFAKMWNLLMRGSIIAAHEGDLEAGMNAKRAATLVLKNWPQK